MQLIIRSLILAILACAATMAAADPIADIYQVEVIVFEHTSPEHLKAENWPKFVGKLDPQNAIDLATLKKDVPESLDTMDVLNALDDAGDKTTATIIQESVKLVEPQNYLMNNEERIIKASKTERLIAHVAWLQPLAINVKSTPVYLQAGNDQEFTAIMAVKAARNNVYTVSIDAIYKLQPADQKYVPGVEEIRITRDVRMKRKEAFYVDHPVVGIIVMVSPVVYGTNSYAPLPNM